VRASDQTGPPLAAGLGHPKASAARGNPRSALSCLLGLLTLALAIPAAAQQNDPLLPFMVQSACLDAAGATIPGRLPFEPGCTRTRPLSAEDPLPYRKHDWPARAQEAALPMGYQASNSLSGTLLGRPAVLQVLDFGGGNRAFGRRDPGDGGQVVVLEGRIAGAVMTEDGRSGVHWFQSPACAPGAPAPGWLLAVLPLQGEWQQQVTRIARGTTPDRCPAAYVPSLTRWRAARITLPWREASTGARSTVPVESLVSEHYSHASVAASNHLERMWFVRHLGLTRWERWENIATSRLPDRERRAALVAGSGRCPDIAFSDPPAAGWQMVDCRTWTNMVRAAPAAALPSLPWPDPALR
jgi:hypothetical protein